MDFPRNGVQGEANQVRQPHTQQSDFHGDVLASRERRPKDDQIVLCRVISEADVPDDARDTEDEIQEQGRENIYLADMRRVPVFLELAGHGEQTGRAVESVEEVAEVFEHVYHIPFEHGVHRKVLVLEILFVGNALHRQQNDHVQNEHN